MGGYKGWGTGDGGGGGLGWWEINNGREKLVENYGKNIAKPICLKAVKQILLEENCRCGLFNRSRKFKF